VATSQAGPLFPLFLSGCDIPPGRAGNGKSSVVVHRVRLGAGEGGTKDAEQKLGKTQVLVTFAAERLL